MELSKKQIELLRLLAANIDEPLTIRELQDRLDLSSPSLVHHHILQLEKKKYIWRNPNNPHDYKILNDPERLLCYVNLYGMATCGPDGKLLSGEPTDRIPLSPKILSFNIEDAFLVKASGDSMEPEIHAGDFIIGKIQPQAENGEKIVCTLNKGVIVKKYFKKNKEILLNSLNPEYPPIRVTKNDDFYIAGVVKGVICNHTHP